MSDRLETTGGVDGATDKSAGLAGILWQRLRRDRFAMTGLYIVLLLCAVSYLAPTLANDKPLIMRYEGRLYFPAVAELFPLNKILRYPELRGVDYDNLRDDPAIAILNPPVPYSPYETSLSERFQAPSRRHWMGTDDLGRDVSSRMIHGASVSLLVGFVAVGIALFIGLLAGALAGFYGGMVDIVVSRIIEVVMCFPSFFLILAVIAFLPPSIYNIMVVIGITRWTAIARYTRGEFLRLKKQDFAYAARALGASDRKIIFRHILPNSLAPILVSATFGIANAILIEAALSFLGFGVQPPAASWGGILSLAREYIEVAWWLATIPGLAIFVTVTGYNILGEGLRDASDPRQTLTESR
ncbi:MAG: ABC transporter permease [Candidatus Krumholzibacteriia bacterium]